MPAPHDPSHRASERRHARPGGDPASDRTEGADRFWEEFSRARPDRRTRGRQDAPPDAKRDEATEAHECLEWCPICRSADVLRAAGGPEVRNQIASLQRESLFALRTLIDAYLARASQPGQAPWDEPPPRPADPPVQDIPLD